MSDRLRVAEAIRVSRAAQQAAEVAAEAQERARIGRIERLERSVQRTINVLFSILAACWLAGLGVIVFWSVGP
jgi:hypothetical protein